ncbi:hypothetical protein VOLCADRAFT_97804 [Volvox carteri f. nagariensis]|uniref:Uncharacterized protein n=1 Tax=Volvox carteri f. nagariensis TaxID=3068 RepID=D8UDN9_VOLCA|nr:uncharacterized protein VOLCADRAFT_97804 [Volvox carteri f. nagariensis]EFJ42074.1 hypothetical protein VOLCADRAFT_97804 [Volvox carteri f. nagariensis]|eukprot:XP_002956771.1 hypothetical protein VOLCADRAFT_97804 [Volvox carteri f. nagariensis]
MAGLPVLHPYPTCPVIGQFRSLTGYAETGYQPPSIDGTIELFTLAPHQAVPFMLMAQYFDRHDEPDPGDPPQMLVEGKPGTGKTQFIQALLWYTFQHGCPHWAATCAYSWAAAAAFNTPVHRSLSTHAMFALSAGNNQAESVRKGSAASLQVHRNAGTGALIIDEIGMNSLDHLGACNQSCTHHLLPPSHLAGDHPAATIFSSRPSANTGDEFQHPKPGGPPLYRYTAAVEHNPQSSPSVPTAQPLHGEDDNNGVPNDAAAGAQGGKQQAEVTTRHTRAVPQTQSCILEGFRVYRALAKTVFLLEKQQRQDSSPSGRRLTEYASMFGGEPATEQRIAEMVDDLNSRAIIDLADLAHLEPRVVLQRNEPRHTLNTRLIMLEANRKNQHLMVWNADHVPVQKRGAAVEPPLTHVEKAVVMWIKDDEFGHTTADTWYYHGARYILLDTTAADAGASHNNEVEACGLLEDGREPADDGRGPYRWLKYLPAAVIVRPVSGHIPETVLQGLGDYASRGGAFILTPRASCMAEVEMPAGGCGTITKQIRHLNVPLGDRQEATGTSAALLRVRRLSTQWRPVALGVAAVVRLVSAGVTAGCAAIAGAGGAGSVSRGAERVDGAFGRRQQIAQVVMSRVGARTWQSYASHFAAFVCFCVGEGLEFLLASHYAGLLWGQFLAAKGSIQVRRAQPYFSAIISVHDLLGYPKPCAGDNTLLAAFHRGWECLQHSTVPASALVLAFSAGDAWHLYEQLAVVPVGSELALPLLFVVLSFCLLLRPDSLLSVTWARVAVVQGEQVVQYKPLNWKGHLVAVWLPVSLQWAVRQRFLRDPSRLWPAEPDIRSWLRDKEEKITKLKNMV